MHTIWFIIFSIILIINLILTYLVTKKSSYDGILWIYKSLENPDPDDNPFMLDIYASAYDLPKKKKLTLLVKHKEKKE